MVDQALKAKWHYSDAFDASQWCGITSAGMKFQKEKPIMRNFATNWLGWLANPIAFRVALKGIPSL